MSWGEINDVSEQIALKIKNEKKSQSLMIYMQASLNKDAILSSFDKSIKFPSYNNAFKGMIDNDVKINRDDSASIKAFMDAKAARINSRNKGGEK